MKYFLAFLLFVSAAFATDPIPAARRTTWTPGVTVGVYGGIPTTRTNIIDVTLTPYFADKTGVANAAPAIQSAINAAMANDIVYFPNGTYKLNSPIYVAQGHNNITLRGQSQAAVTLVCAESGILVGTGATWDTPSTGNTITAGLTQGGTVVTMADTSAFTNGQVADLLFANDPAVPVVNVSGYEYSAQQKVMVTAKTGTTLTFRPGIAHAPNAALPAKVYKAVYPVSGVGIENMTLDGTASGLMAVGVNFLDSWGCWAKGVKVVKSKNYGFVFDNCFECELLTSDVRQRYGGAGGSNGGGIDIANSSSCLVWDCIVEKYFPLLEVNFGSSANAICYNFWIDSGGGAGMDTNHSSQNRFNLYEGNIAPNIQCDGYFGGADTDTIFRNWLTGLQPGLSPAQSTAGINMSLNRFTRAYNLVGNVFGNLQFTNSANGVNLEGNPNIGNGSSAGVALNNDWADWAAGAGLTGSVTSRGTVSVNGSASTDVLTLSSANPQAAPQGVIPQVVLTVTSGLAGLSNNTTYWVIAIDSTHLKLASSMANAQSATPVNITTDGTGAITSGSAVLSFTGPNGVGQITDGYGNGTPGIVQSQALQILYALSGTSYRAANYQADLVSGTSVTIGDYVFGGSLVTTGDPLPPAGTSFTIWTGAGGFQELDKQVAETTLRKGNYYAYTNVSDGTGSDTLSTSYLMAVAGTAPPWWNDTGTYVWPPFDWTAPTDGMSYSRIPAGYRFVALTAPTIPVASIGSAGNTLTLLADKPLSDGGDGKAGFTFNVGGVTLTYASGAGTTSLVYNISRVVSFSENLLLNYTQPGHGWVDSLNNPVATFTGLAVANHSTQDGGAIWLGNAVGGSTSDAAYSPGFSYITPITVTSNGTVSSLRAYFTTNPGNAGIKMAFYNNSGGLLRSATVGTLSGTNNYNAFPISSVSVTPGTYWVSMNVLGDMGLRYSTVTGGFMYNESVTYANFPPSTLASDGTQNRGYVMGALFIPSDVGGNLTVNNTLTITGTLTLP